MTKIIINPLKKIEITPNLKENLFSDVDEESHVIIHFSFTSTFFTTSLRAWKSTYLISQDGNTSVSKLLSIANISLYPKYTNVPAGQSLNFTYIFSGLPKRCKTFDLIEDIPESGAFIFRNIKRNKTDVYTIEL